MSFRQWLRSRKTNDKPYDPQAWERSLPPGELQHVYDDQGWTGLSGQWRQRSLERLTARLHELQQTLPSEVTLLDVACFSGDYFGRLMQQDILGGRFRYTGADVTPTYVANAASRWRGCANADFKQGSALDLPFPDNSFDIVFNHGMLIHVEDVAACFRQFARVARAYVIVETTVNPQQQESFVDENKSGQKFIDRVYRPDYIRDLLGQAATIVKETTVPYIVHQSTLFEAVPR